MADFEPLDRDDIAGTVLLGFIDAQHRADVFAREIATRYGSETAYAGKSMPRARVRCLSLLFDSTIRVTVRQDMAGALTTVLERVDSKKERG